MAHFIKVGPNYINMKRVTEIRPRVGQDGGAELRVYFGLEDWSNFGGEQAAALQCYIDSEAFDVVAFYRETETERAEKANRKEAAEVNLAALEKCANAVGHIWEWEDPGGWQCRLCSARYGRGRLDAVIEVWGGVAADAVLP